MGIHSSAHSTEATTIRLPHPTPSHIVAQFMWVSRTKSVVICIQGRCSNTGIHLAFRPGCHFVAATRALHISLIYGALPLLCSTVLYGRSAENKLNGIMGDGFFFVLMCKLLLYQLFSKRERFTIPLNEFYASIAKLCLAHKLSLCENTAQEQLCWECSDLNWPVTVAGQSQVPLIRDNSTT